MEENDIIYARNSILALLKLDSYEETGKKCDSIDELEEIPTRIMKLHTKGKLEIGYDTDIVIFDDDINIKKVLVAKEVNL